MEDLYITKNYEIQVKRNMKMEKDTDSKTK